MAEDPTPGELHRLIEALTRSVDNLSNRLDQRFDNMEARFVAQAVFQAEQEATRRVHETLSKDLSDWKAESRGEHARLDGRQNTFESEVDGKFDAVESKIQGERERADQIERAARSERGNRLLTIGLAALSAVLAIGGLIINAVGG